MKYLKFNYNIGSISHDSFISKILWSLLRFVFPDPNPDFSHLYCLVETWYIEIDEECKYDGVCREIGTDINGRIIVKDPDDRNYGYWTDVNGGINDCIDKMNAKYITREEFESVWNEELVKVSRKDYP